MKKFCTFAATLGMILAVTLSACVSPARIEENRAAEETVGLTTPTVPTAPRVTSESSAAVSASTDSAADTSAAGAGQAVVSIGEALGFPPDERVPCHICEGTRQTVCIACDGSGITPSAGLDPSLYDSFGLGGLADALNNMPCLHCTDGVMQCMYGVCTGDRANPERLEYAKRLVDLSKETGVRIFALEDNQVSPYVALDFCDFGMCDGTGMNQTMLMFDSFIICGFCNGEGYRLTFVDSFTQEQLTARVCDWYRNLPRLDPLPMPDYNRRSTSSCLTPACSNSRPSSGHPYCTSCQASRGAIDIGGDSSGRCIICHAKVYGTSPYCANHP
jgi:hypothetical protein